MPRKIDLWKCKKSTLKNKVWKEFSAYIIRRDRERCVLCGRGREQGVVLQAGHVLSGRCDTILFDERGVFCQCKKCNQFHNDYPWPYWNWYIQRFGQEAFEELKRIKKGGKILDRGELIEIYAWYKDENQEYNKAIGVKQ